MWCDLLIVGNDPAGTQIALMAARAGLSVALVRDSREENVTTQQTVEALTELADRIESRPAGVARPTIAECRGELRKIFRRDVELADRLLARCGVDVLTGDWRWQSDRRIDVATATGRVSIEGERVVLATGDRYRRPVWMNRGDLMVETADRFLEWSDWPQTAVVAGIDRTGWAVARLLAAVGVSVTLVDRRDRGVKLPGSAPWGDIVLGRWVVGLTADDRREPQVVLHDGNLLRTDAVVVALGTEAREPGINFRRLGAKTDDRGRLWCGANFETTVRGLFAAGRLVASVEAATGYESAVALLRSEFPASVEKMMSRPRAGLPVAVRSMVPAGQLAGRAVPVSSDAAPAPSRPVPFTRLGAPAVVFDSRPTPTKLAQPVSRPRAAREVPVGWRVVG